ncbi:MAG TPA: aldose epimerase family protein [Sphingobacterium sp.]|nr:aldose epimerase family protein [Sphingobacterium sp.]
MKRQIILFSVSIVALMALSCQPKTEKRSGAVLPDIENFQSEVDGETVSLYHLKNGNGMEAAFTNFGARIVSLIVPDKEEKLRDVVLGFSKGSDYHNSEEPFFGPIVGPFGNRINKGKFQLDDKEYQLQINNEPNTLHGGFDGLHFQVWHANVLSEDSIEFTCELPDGKDGFPGNRKLKVIYSLTKDNSLVIDYEGTTDEKTILNLTNHAYFNLNGEGSGTILKHRLKIFADDFTPVDSTLIPTGEIASVENTPFDFTEFKEIGRDIEKKDEQLQIGKGYDHNFVMSGEQEDGYNRACELIGDESGIRMEILTKEPGLQFYSGNFMSDKVTLKNGATDSFRTALCLEPQHFPDSPNQSSFPSTVIEPGETYKTTSIYKFSTE